MMVTHVITQFDSDWDLACMSYPALFPVCFSTVWNLKIYLMIVRGQPEVHSEIFKGRGLDYVAKTDLFFFIFL